MLKNKILTTLNQALEVTNLYTLEDPSGNPIPLTDLEGLPLGTATNASDGELGIKVILIADRSTPSGSVNDSKLPYGADEQVIDPIAAGPATIVYKKSGTTLKTRTFTYNGSGGSSTSDRVIGTVDA